MRCTLPHMERAMTEDLQVRHSGCCIPVPSDIASFSGNLRFCGSYDSACFHTGHEVQALGVVLAGGQAVSFDCSILPTMSVHHFLPRLVLHL